MIAPYPISFLSGLEDEPDEAKEFLAPYAPGKAITVYYDPARPQHALLLTYEDVVQYLVPIGFGVLILLLTPVFFYAAT